MENYQQELIDIMVKKVLNKHGVKTKADLSEDEKDRIKNVVEKIQKDVDDFMKKQHIQVSENDFEDNKDK